MFSNNLLEGRNQYLVLLSNKEQIKQWEDIEGIITPWDLPQLFTHIQLE